MRRRRYLASTALVALPAIAGCSGSSDDDDSSGDNDSTGNGTDDDDTGGDSSGDDETSDDGTGGDGSGDDETSDDGTGGDGSGDDGTSDDGTGNGDDTGDGETEMGELPGWAEWIPAGTVTEGTTLTVVDTDRMRRELPDRYAETPASGLADIFGFDEEDMNHAVDLSDAATGANVFDVVTGEFDREGIFEHLSIAESETESYREFELVETEDSIGAFGESAVIVAPERSNVEAVIDTKASGAPSLGEADEDWRRLFRAVDEVAMGVMAAGTGAVGPQAPFDVETIGVLFDATDGEQIRMTGQYVFTSASRAESVLADQREALVDHFSGETEGTIQRVEQEGNRVVVTMLTTDVSFE